MEITLISNGLFNDFTLGQFHFHANSEHQIDGTYAPLEAHFVCCSIWENKYIVISVLFEVGASSDFLAQFLVHLSSSENQPYVNESLTYQPFNLLPGNRGQYRYSGTLTTPPCSEVVTWIVMENKVQARTAQINAFKNIMGSNFRPIQGTNGRTIDYVEM